MRLVHKLLTIVALGGVAFAATITAAHAGPTAGAHRHHQASTIQAAAPSQALVDFNVRSGPYFSYPQIGFVEEDTELVAVCYIYNVGRYWDVVYSSGANAVIGFVPEENIDGIAYYPCSTGIGARAAFAFNLRSGPYFTYRQVGSLSNGVDVLTQCYVVSVGRIWEVVWRPGSNSLIGWAPAANLTFPSSLRSSPC